MSGSTLGGRLQRLERILHSATTEAFLTERAGNAAWSRIQEGTASREDFVGRFGPDLQARREDLAGLALARQARAHPSSHDLLHGTVWDRVFEILASDPAGPLPEDSYQCLVAMAGKQPAAWDPSERWGGPPEDTCWFGANVAIVVLGEDHGASLRNLVAPRLARLREEQDVRAAQFARELQERIDSGTARWLDFYFLHGGEENADRPALTVMAAQRRQAREAGQPMPLDDYDHLAAEIASYPRTSDGADTALHDLQFVCDMATPAGVLGHDEWLEANRWRRALGGGWGTKLRDHLALHWTDYLEEGDGASI